MSRFDKFIRFIENIYFSQTQQFITQNYLSNLDIFHTHLWTKMEQTECSETSAYKIQTQGNYPEENIQHLLTNFSAPVQTGLGRRQISSNMVTGSLFFPDVKRQGPCRSLLTFI